MNNRIYTQKFCYNISMINLIEKNKIEKFKIEISKSIINLTKNHDQYHIEEFEYYNCEETYRMIKLLNNIRTFLECL